MCYIVIITGVNNSDEIDYTAGPNCSIQLVYTYNETEQQAICLQSDTNQCFHTLNDSTTVGTKLVIHQNPKTYFLAQPISGL